MSLTSASTQSRLGSATFYRGVSNGSSDYHPKFVSSFSSRSPSLDNSFTAGTLPRRYGMTSSVARPLPVGPSVISGSQYDSPSVVSPSSSSSVRSIPIRYNDTSSTSMVTLGRRPATAMSYASSKPPLPSGAYERVSSSLGTSRYQHLPSTSPHLGINRYIRSSSTDRSSAPASVYPRYSTADDQYRRLPGISTNIEIFERLSDQTRPYSATFTSRRPPTSHEDYLHGRSPSPLSSSQRSHMNGTTVRTVPTYYGREQEDEERDILSSLVTSPSASSGIGTNVGSGGTAGGSVSHTGLYRSRVGAVSVPDVPTYARGYVDETRMPGNANLNSPSLNGYSSGSRRNSVTNSPLERQELEDDEDESNEEKTAREEAELRRKYSPANYRRPSETDSRSATGNVSSSEMEKPPAWKEVSSDTRNWPTGRYVSSAATSNGAVSNGANNAFVKNEPNRSSTSSVDSSESSRLSSGRSSNVSDGGNSRYGESSRYIRDDDNNGSKRSGLTGLRNLGNTCFMNSVIQCLSNTRPLRDYCLHSSSTLSTDINNNTTSRMKGALIKAFRELLAELWSTTKGSYVSADRFKTQIQKFAPRFTGYSQQDAQEFLRYLLQGLHEDINRVQSRPPALAPIEDSLPDPQKAMDSWKRYLRVDESKVVDIFVGQLKSELKCTHCGNVSTTFDPFWDLSLPIPQDSRRNQVTLNDCLDAFTKEEVLDGDEKPTCDLCKTRRRCTKKFSIQKYPAVLVLHLKRFSGERYRSRLSTLVDFPLMKLDLSPYAAVKSAVTPTYDLYAVSNHCGTPVTGHYTAYCKNPQSGRWFLFDDSRVTPANERSVVSSEAYVLFYELSTSGSSSRL